MRVLALDFGSSSVKAAVLSDERRVRRVATAFYPTAFSASRAELSSARVLKALRDVLAQLPNVKAADVIAFSVMAPAWIALDSLGRAVTPFVTHQDRRSVREAHQLEHRVGVARHLEVTGNRPFPGGISSTTWAWFHAHEPTLMKQADLVGHLNTFLIRVLTNQRVIDPSNASFTGLYRTITQTGWDDTLLAAAGIKRALLPDILPSNQVAGRVTVAAARKYGLRQGAPVLAGCVDTSAAMLLAGAAPGQLLNVSGSTDVLALCTDRPVPNAHLLTRALGVGDKWMSVSTLASAGSAVDWMHQTLFADVPAASFYKAVRQLARSPLRSSVTISLDFAGDRTSIDQTTATLGGLSLATTRREILSALIESLARASAARFERLAVNVVKPRDFVVTSGGSAKLLGSVLHRDWPGKWTFREEPHATLRGLYVLSALSP